MLEEGFFSWQLTYSIPWKKQYWRWLLSNQKAMLKSFSEKLHPLFTYPLRKEPLGPFKVSEAEVQDSVSIRLAFL